MSQFQKIGSIEILCDNQSTIAVAKAGGYNPRTKHIDIRHHLIRDVLERKVVNIDYVTSEDQLADELTKPLSPVKGLSINHVGKYLLILKPLNVVNHSYKLRK